ncbi:MAG TPA: GPGG-motif small membrane protein [Acidimicrobiales bacterium]|nr:GPGG-motif small membrane protein [Acidimicrobiales bacterium]
MIAILSILALIIAVYGIVRIVKGDILWGILLLVLACAVGPGGWSVVA